MFSEYTAKKAGSKTTLNYVLQLSLFAFVPSLLIALFSLMLFNVGLQKYFDRKITSAVKNSYEVAKNYMEESKRSVEADIFLVSFDLNRYSSVFSSNPNRFKQFLRTQRLLRRVDEIYLLDGSGEILLSDTTQETIQMTTVCGLVLKMGDLCYQDNDKFPKGPWCKLNDWIIFSRYAGSRFKIEGGEVRVLNDDEVIAKINDPSDILHHY